MSKPIKSGVRSMLYTMINNYEQVKSEFSEAAMQKQRLLDEILSASARVDDEVRNSIQGLVLELQKSQENEMLNSKSRYITQISTMTGPPGVQFENSLLQIAPVDKAKCPFVRDHNDVEFRLYTKHNPTVYQELIIDDDEKLFASNIDFHAPTVIHFHAFMETTDDGSSTMIREAYILRGDTNIIMVDASRLEAGPWYFTAAENTWYIGNFAAKFIDYLVSRGLDLKNTHMTGHSLGAQSAGVAGFALKSGRVARITGMDPALPLFHGLPEEQRLDKSDADFVDVIHTDSGIFGVNKPVGHADFYPNGGISPQPGCELEVVIPQQMLLNKCDKNTQPRSFYTYHLTPNRSMQKLQYSLKKLFTKIHAPKSVDENHQPIRVSKKGGIFKVNTTHDATGKQEEDQIMIERINSYKTIPHSIAITNKDVETGIMKPIYKNIDYTRTHVEDIKKTSGISIKENTAANIENYRVHKYNSQAKLRLQHNMNREIELGTTDEHGSKETVRKEQFEADENTSTQMLPQDIVITKKNKSDLIDSTNKQAIHKILHSETKPTKKNNQMETQQKDIAHIKKQTIDEETTNTKTDTATTKKQTQETTTNKDTTHKSHATKRLKRFINPFQKSETEQQQNFLFRILDFMFKHGRNIPVYSVMREINTLVKSAQGELNHVSRESNNFIGAPPLQGAPVIPVTYSLELGGENKALVFMKRLLGLAPKGDRLTVNGK